MEQDPVVAGGGRDRSRGRAGRIEPQQFTNPRLIRAVALADVVVSIGWGALSF
jgi:hypothetical protein